MTNKPRILVLGGCGFIGRHLVEYLVQNDLASRIRVVDKTPPQMAWLNRRHTEVFNNSIIEFCSANLINTASCHHAFSVSTEHSEWDYVFNCAAEIRPGQTDAVYNEGIYKLSINCASESAASKCKRYIEFSSGNMASSDQIPMKEDDAVKPWTFVAQHKIKVEQQLKEMDLNYTILRLPIVYGVGDKRGLTPRIVIAALYKPMGEAMKLLWNESMKLNTVHVVDVVSAAYELATNPIANKQCYNIVDDSQSTQGSISRILGEIFNIKVDYWGMMMSSITKFKMQAVVEEINDKHMGPWADLCQIDHTENTPLTPYMDEELLYYKHLNLCNSKLKDTGYKLKAPFISKEKIEEVILDFLQNGLLPPSLALK